MSTRSAERRRKLNLPEENLLYFIEKISPRLQSWEREILRIVRLIAQYFYPQPQAKVMNEGCATWVHQRIMTRLHETGQIDDAAFLEVLHSTSNVIMQPGFDHPASSGDFNPYALGYAMMTDIERMCTASHGGGPGVVPRYRRAMAIRWGRCAMAGRISATRASCCNSSPPP